jgi:mRNA-degrading endonuclease toxin of MazEF toxin-antitoxin module
MMYNTDIFDEWNEEKKALHVKDVFKYANEREIRYCKLWVNVWFEQNWKEGFRRPVLILKRVGSMFFVCPLTTKWKDNNFYYKIQQLIGNKISWCILSQVRIIDKKRLLHLIETLVEKEFLALQKILRNMYF